MQARCLCHGPLCGLETLLGCLVLISLVRILILFRSNVTPQTLVFLSRELLVDLGGLAVAVLMLLSGIGLLNTRPWGRRITHVYCIALVAWSAVANLSTHLQRLLIEHYGGGGIAMPVAGNPMQSLLQFPGVSVALSIGYALFLMLMLGKKPRATLPYEGVDNDDGGAVDTAN